MTIATFPLIHDLFWPSDSPAEGSSIVHKHYRRAFPWLIGEEIKKNQEQVDTSSSLSILIDQIMAVRTDLLESAYSHEVIDTLFEDHFLANPISRNTIVVKVIHKGKAKLRMNYEEEY